MKLIPFLIPILAILFLIFLFKRTSKDSKFYKWLEWLINLELYLYSAVLIIGFFVAVIYLGLDTFYLKEKRTLHEMEAIKAALVKYHARTGVYPQTIKELIGPNPIYRTWEVDKWGNEYLYQAINKKRYEIRSSGKDGKFYTNDDLVLK